MQKDKYLYKEMQHYRRKYLAINIIITILFMTFTLSKLPYLVTSVKGETPLDTERFAREAGTFTMDTVTELGRKDTKQPDNNCFRSNSYWQDNTYLFSVTPDSVTDTGKVFTQEIEDMSGVKETVDVYRVFLADIEGKKVPVITYANKENPDSFTGYITELSKVINASVSEYVAETTGSEEICEYMIDARDSEMDTSGTDPWIFLLWLALLIFLWAKLIVQYVNPLKTPTYRQLVKYGDVFTVEQMVNEQIEDAVKEKNKKILKDFIVFRDTFRLAVNRNHTAKN